MSVQNQGIGNGGILKLNADLLSLDKDTIIQGLEPSPQIYQQLIRETKQRLDR